MKKAKYLIKNLKKSKSSRNLSMETGKKPFQIAGGIDLHLIKSLYHQLIIGDKLQDLEKNISQSSLVVI